MVRTLNVVTDERNFLTYNPNSQAQNPSALHFFNILDSQIPL